MSGVPRDVQRETSLLRLLKMRHEGCTDAAIQAHLSMVARARGLTVAGLRESIRSADAVARLRGELPSRGLQRLQRRLEEELPWP